MGSGRTVTQNKDTDDLNERLADLRGELREALADETTAQNAVHHAETSLRQNTILAQRAMTRVRRCSAALALWQKELGDKGVIVDELDDHEIVRVDGVSHRLPVVREAPPIGDAAAVARFDHALKAEAHAVHDVPPKHRRLA